MTPGRLDLEIPRNGSDARIVQLFGVDPNGQEEVIDLTGFSFSAQARDRFGGAAIALGTVAIDDAAEGKVSLKWVGSQFDTFGSVQATAVAAWDLLMTDALGLPSIPVRGLLYISPEATA